MPRPSIKQVMSFTALASILTLLTSVVKIKVISIYFGPIGVGLVGLMQSIFQLSGLIVSNGMSTSGIKKVAEHTYQDDTINRNLFLGLLIGVILQSIVALILIYAFSEKILNHLELKTLSNVYLLSLGVVAFSIFSVMQAICTGLRKIKQLIKVQICAAILGSSIGVALSLIYGESYLVMCVVATPIVSATLSFVILRPHFDLVGNASLREAVAYWLEVNRIGIFIVMSSGVGLLTQTVLKLYIARYQGLEQLGFYHAAITISTTYLSVIIVALTNDFLPRISEAKDKYILFAIVDKQISVVAIVTIPIVFTTLIFAPSIVSILYSVEYVSSIALLRLLIIGDLLRCFSIILAYTLLAQSKLNRMLLAEFFANSILLFGSFMLLPYYGIIGIGYAYCAMYILYFPLLLFLTRHEQKFLVSFRSMMLIMGILFILVFLSILLQIDERPYTIFFCIFIIFVSPVFLRKEFELILKIIKPFLESKI